MMFPRSQFLTLTYSDERIPHSGSLRYKDVQLFLKRLRKSSQGDVPVDDGSRPIRYFVVGEYGSDTGRPHYHALLFNYGFEGSPIGEDEFVSPELEDLWQNGNARFSHLTPGRIAYATRYAMKKVMGPAAVRHYGEREPEFVQMSRRPGIGAVFFSKYWKDLSHDFAVIEGRKVPLNRYYRDRLRSVDPALSEDLEQRRYEKRLPLEERSDERREVRAEVARRKYDHFSKRGM